MKRSLFSLIATIGISVLLAVSSVQARGDGGGWGWGRDGGGQRSGGGGWGHWHGDSGGYYGGYHGGYYHGGYWGNGGWGFYFGGPLWWPYYSWGWPYYSSYPYYPGTAYYQYPDYSYSATPPPVYYYDGAYSYQQPAQPQDNRSYLVLGHDWGKDLRLETVTWDWFVQYLRAYVINAPPGVRDDFRRGFLNGYGENADAALDKAMQQAAQPPPGNIPAPPAPGSRVPVPSTPAPAESGSGQGPGK